MDINQHAQNLDAAREQSWGQALIGWGGTEILREVLADNKVPPEKVQDMMEVIKTVHKVAFNEGAAFAAVEALKTRIGKLLQ